MADLNPASFMQSNPMADFRVNPMAGAMAGMNIGAGQQLLDRSMRDSDLSYQEQLLKYQMQQAQAPSQKAQYQQAQNEADMQNSLYDTGLKKQAATSDIATHLDTNTTQQSKNAASRALDAGEEANRISQELDKNPIQNYMDGSGQKRWDDYRKRLGDHGITLPPTPDPDTVQTLHDKAASFVENREHIQKIAQINATGSNQLKVTQAQTESTEKIANQRNAVELAIAASHSGAALEAATRKVQNGTATPADLLIYNVSIAEKIFGPTMTSSLGQLTGVTGSPQERVDGMNKLLETMVKAVTQTKATGGASAPTPTTATPPAGTPPAQDAPVTTPPPGIKNLSGTDAKSAIDRVAVKNPSMNRQALIAQMKKDGVLDKGYTE